MTATVKKKNIWLERLLVALILLAGFFVRLYDLTDPPLDFHASRQLRSAIITRAFYLQGQADAAELSAKASQLAALERYEPPIMEWIVSRMDRVIGREVFWTGRIFSAFFWMVGGWFLYRLARKMGSAAVGIIALLVYFFLPFSIIASRSFQPDPWLCAWVIAAAWFLSEWQDKPGWGRLLTAAVCGGAAILVKPIAAFFIGFMFLFCLPPLIRSDGWKKTLAQALVGGGLMLLPSILYYVLLSPARSGDFLSFWVVSLSGLIFTSKFYAGWIAMIKGLTGLILPVLAIWGVVLADHPRRSLLTGWWLGYLVYGLVFPYQIMTHEYYSLILIPLVALSVVPACSTLWGALENGQPLRRAALVLTLTLAAGYGAYAACGTLRATDYTLEPASWRRVGDAIPEDAPFIALTGDYGMRLIYYGWRMPALVWPDAKDSALFELAGISAESFERYFAAQTAGQDYFVVTALGELARQPELEETLESYPLLQEGNGFLIFDLRKSHSSDVGY